jgi:hypothetical protein
MGIGHTIDGNVEKPFSPRTMVGSLVWFSLLPLLPFRVRLEPADEGFVEGFIIGRKVDFRDE